MNPLDYLNSKKKTGNYYLQGWTDQFLGQYGGGSFGPGAFSGGRGGSGMVSSTGIGGRSRREIVQSQPYQQVQADTAASEYQALLDRIKMYEDTMKSAGYAPTAAFAQQQVSQYAAPKGLAFGPKVQLQTLGTGVTPGEMRKLKAQADKAELEAAPETIKLTMEQKRSEAELRKARAASLAEKDKMGWANLELKKASQDAKLAGREAEAEALAQYDSRVMKMPAEAKAIAYKPQFVSAIKSGAAPDTVADTVEAAVKVEKEAAAALAEAKADIEASRRQYQQDRENYRRGAANKDALQRRLQVESAKLAGYQAYIGALSAPTPEQNAAVAQQQAIVNDYIGMLGTDTTQQQGLPVGTVDSGYVYIGGDPSKPESWRKQ
jgi:hypothetical protein